MLGISEPVVSNQDGLHPHLEKHVLRHLRSPWRGQIAEHTRTAFAELSQWRTDLGWQKPFILDSGCGTGRSSVMLAQRFPDALVVGVDQSAQRLAKGWNRFQPLPDNVHLLRAEAADLWRLMAAEQWRLAQHYLLYPNPWPKAAHVTRRWHGHPAWKELLALGGDLVCRTNWPVYVEEMRKALAITDISATLTVLQEDKSRAAQSLTDFEEKYLLSGHDLWQLEAKLP